MMKTYIMVSKMLKRMIFLALILLLVVPLASAVCTVTLNKDGYHNSETATVTMTCSEVAEKNDAYVLNWTNGTTQLELDTGSTPSQVDTNFFESYTIPSDYSAIYGDVLNVSLIDTGDLEGQDNATVTTASTNDIIIQNIGWSATQFIGNIFGAEAEVVDENGNKISGANCQVVIEDTASRPIIESTVLSHSGEIHTDFLLDSAVVEEGTQYLLKFYCYCGIVNSSNSCVNNQGGQVGLSTGSSTETFTTDTWLSVNTVTNKANYVGREEMFICANVTNIDALSRVPMEIYHQVRCSNGVDNDDDLDRALIFSDDGMPDERGISTGSTQMQCKRFIVPEPHFLQGRSSECYASTSVWVLDNSREKVISYVTSSQKMNITIDDLNIDADWQFTSENTFNTIINLSADKYSCFNADGTGNLDIRLDKQYLESIKAEDQYFKYPQRITSFTAINLINNVTVTNSSGDIIDYVMEVLDDGNIEIEVRDVDITSTGWYNITMVMESFDERQTEALEGIENKTGTFKLDINCPSQGDGLISCTISAQVEDSQQMEKEVDFTCYLLYEGVGYSQLNFNQMVTRTLFTTSKTFSIPEIVPDNAEATIQCEAGYYNLGSRTDVFYDTFVNDKGKDSLFGTIAGLQKKTFLTITDFLDGKLNFLQSAFLIMMFSFLFLGAIWIKSRKNSKDLLKY